MATYRKDKDSRGIEYAQKNNSDELESELLKPLREARDVLMTYRSFGLIPIVCSASFIETHAMIMANYRKTRMLEAVHRYRDWIVAVSDGPTESTLSGAIVAARKKQQNDQGTLPSSEAYECWTRFVVAPPGQGACGPVPVFYRARDFKTGNFNRNPVYTIDPQLDPSIEQLVKSGVLPKEERPVKIKVDMSGSQMSFQSCGTKVSVPGKDDAWLNALFKQSCSDLDKRAADTEGAVSQQLTEDGMRLVVLRSLKHAADEGRTFLNKIAKSIDQMDSQS